MANGITKFMEIIFLGTGGGRINLLKQIRLTGGFRINSKSANIHVDPGPGALINSVKAKQNIFDLDTVIVSHNHIDHSNDAGLLIEAMSDHALKNGGILIASENSLGTTTPDHVISKFHQKLVLENYTAKWSEKKMFKTKKKNSYFEIEIIKTDHGDRTGFGFKISVDGKAIGYTSDTGLFDGMPSLYKGCDALVLNCLKLKPDNFNKHLSVDDSIELLKVAKPKLAILNHMGTHIIEAGPELIAKRIEKESGVKTVAAKDFQILEI